MWQATNFGKELVRQDADVRLLQASRGENIDRLTVGCDGHGHQLTDSGFDLLGRLCAGSTFLVQR
jgi:hypothetical protein